MNRLWFVLGGLIVIGLIVAIVVVEMMAKKGDGKPPGCIKLSSDPWYKSSDNFASLALCLEFMANNTTAYIDSSNLCYIDDGPKTDTEGAPNQQSVWYYEIDGEYVNTCVASGPSEDPCPTGVLVCGGGDTKGDIKSQILAVADAVKNGGKNPSCPT